MADLARSFRSRYRRAIKHAIRGRTELALNICWELRLEPRLGLYRRSMVNVMFALILEPFGEIEVIEQCLGDLSSLSLGTKGELQWSIEYMRLILQGYAKKSRKREILQGRLTTNRHSRLALDQKMAVINQYQWISKDFFRLLRESPFSGDISEAWEQEERAGHDELVKLEMAHLSSEESCAQDLSSAMARERAQGNLIEDEEQEISIRETVVEAWLDGLKKRKAEIQKQEIRLMEQKGFSLMDQFQGLLKQINTEAEFAEAQTILDEEL